MVHLSKAEIKQIKSLQIKKFRDSLGLFVAEGEKCIDELRHAFQLQLLVNSGNATDSEICQMSSLRTPQGVLAVFHKPQPVPLPAPQDGLVLVLDGVQDPGNLGTIIRTACWFGVRHIVCSIGTADCFAPKVVQATMGALARVHIHYVPDLARYITSVSSPQLPVYGTLLDGRSLYAPQALPERSRGLLIMGSEGHGISEEVRRLVTHPLLVPAAADSAVESLNVAIATAIVLAELRRPVTQTNL